MTAQDMLLGENIPNLARFLNGRLSTMLFVNTHMVSCFDSWVQKYTSVREYYVLFFLRV